jgi:hypothetical protein
MEDKMNIDKKEKIHIILIIITFVIFIGNMRLMRFYANNLLKYSKETVLDLRIGGYNVDEARKYLNELNEDGRNYYANNFHFIDTFYPMIYGIFYIIILSYFIKKFFPNNKMANIFLILPIIGIICDYGENFFINYTIKAYNNISEIIINISSIFTIMKFITVYMSLLLSVVFLIAFIMKKIINGVRRNFT